MSGARCSTRSAAPVAAPNKDAAGAAFQDTIFALSSGAPPAGVAVIRVSGTAAGDALDRLTARSRPAPRSAVLRTLRAGEDMLDRALVLWLPGPATVTGEDMVELHLHGGRAVVAGVLGALSRIPGLRQAEAGEFTRRAYEHGRIDLIEAEALGDLLAAETEGQRRNAMILAGGALSRAIEGWQARLLGYAAGLEALLDFSDEIDVGPLDPALREGIAEVAGDIAAWRARPLVDRLRDGVRVVIGGPPNAGKSTLLNALVGREAAIVTPIAGTTRDLVEVPVAIGATPFLFTDTAGLREDSGDVVEDIGIDRAQRALAAADIVLWLGDAGQAPEGAILISAKADLGLGGEGLALSAMTGHGIDGLVDILLERARGVLPAEGEAALSARQRDGIARIGEALELAAHEEDPILIAESLRAALAACDALTGRAGTEAMLDQLFGRFCIGK